MNRKFVYKNIDIAFMREVMLLHGNIFDNEFDVIMVVFLLRVFA